MKIHFSIDDVIGCLLYLTRHDCGSIFESYVFDFARSLWEDFGIQTTCNCMYTDGVHDLREVSAKLKSQFRENSEWLKFSFHCFGPDSDYEKADRETFARDYQRVMGELKRIAGEEACAGDIVRLHFFAGSAETVGYLREQGIRILLTADDGRRSYDLEREEEERLRRDGIVSKNGMTYIRTDCRAERPQQVSNADGARKEGEHAKREMFVLFTHEGELGNRKIRDRICDTVRKQAETENHGRASSLFEADNL